MAFPHIQLGSGIGQGRGAEASQQNGFLSGHLSVTTCLRHSFSSGNVAYFFENVNPCRKNWIKNNEFGFHNHSGAESYKW
jgi:hypothetical protein